MFKKPSRSVNMGRKIKLLDKRPLPEPAEEVTDYPPTIDQQIQDGDIKHEFGSQSSKNIDPFTLTDMSVALPRCPSVYSQSSVPSREDNYSRLCQSTYYDDQNSEIGSAAWDEYWDRCETESSDFSQSGASFMSWSDEIEVETTKKVQDMYDEVERFLYDEGPSHNLSAEMLEECLQWKSKFKYLRIVGVGIKPTETTELPAVETDEDEVFCVNSSDSDDDNETITQETPSYVELNEEAERFKYDDITMGSNCESDRSVLNEKLTKSVMDGLFAYVWPKVETILEPHVSNFIKDVATNASVNKSTQRPASNFLSRNPRSILPDHLNSTYNSRPSTTLQQIDVNHSLQIAPKSLHQSARTDQNRTNLFSERPASKLINRPTTVAKSLSPLSRSVITTPLNVSFEPAAAASRAYHSALNRQTSSKSTSDRRLSSISMGYAGRRISRQEAILKDLKEGQEKLTEKTTTVYANKKSATEVRKKCPWTGNLPPIDRLELSIHSQGSGRPEPKASNSISTSRIGLAPNTLEPINFTNSFEIHGAGLTKVELTRQNLDKARGFPEKLSKYKPIGKQTQ